METVTPAPFDRDAEMKKQTDLLSRINNKLGFIVFIIVIAGILQVFAALLSF